MGVSLRQMVGLVHAAGAVLVVRCRDGVDDFERWCVMFQGVGIRWGWVLVFLSFGWVVLKLDGVVGRPC
jgi:hypothetical protein